MMNDLTTRNSFDYHHGAILAVRPWQIVINPKSVEENWFLRKKRTVGHGPFILKYLITPLIIIRITALIVFEILEDSTLYEIDPFLISSITIITTMFIGIIFGRYPQYEDGYFIRNELRLFFVWAVSVNVVAVAINVSILWFGVPFWWLHAWQQFLLCGCLLITIVWPKWKIHMQFEAYQLSLVARSSEVDTESTEIPKISARNLLLRRMRTKKEFEMFAAFLSRQFALEV